MDTERHSLPWSVCGMLDGCLRHELSFIFRLLTLARALLAAFKDILPLGCILRADTVSALGIFDGGPSPLMITSDFL
eukprot:scaffold346191_cov38-Prasinocladus_malaysianus.AAC.1